MYTDGQDNFYLVYLLVCWSLGLGGKNRDEVEREGKGKISSPVSVSYEGGVGGRKTHKKRESLCCISQKASQGREYVCLWQQIKKRKCLSNGSRK